MKKNALGFAQSILVTGPSSVTFRVESYVAVKGSWAGVLVVNRRTITPEQMKGRHPRFMVVSLL
jgi:hypothetical protein